MSGPSIRGRDAAVYIDESAEIDEAFFGALSSGSMPFMIEHDEDGGGRRMPPPRPKSPVPVLRPHRNRLRFGVSWLALRMPETTIERRLATSIDALVAAKTYRPPSAATKKKESRA